MKTKTTILSVILLTVTLTCQPLALARKVNDKMGNYAMAEQPDLVINKVTVVNKATGSFEIIVHNKGKLKAPGCQLSLLIKDQNGKDFASKNTNQPPLQPGQSSTVKMSVNKALGANYKYTVTTDATEKVAEVDDTNNAWQGHVVGLTQAEGPSENNDKMVSTHRPDLVVGIYPKPTGTEATVTVSNKCKGKAPASRVMLKIQKTDGSGVYVYVYNDVPPLAPGAKVNVTFKLLPQLGVKDFAIPYFMFQVDPENKVKEASEGNNTWLPHAQPFPDKGGYCDPPYDD